MTKKRMSAHAVISYLSWLRQCTIQEFCFFLSLSFLATNLFFEQVKCSCPFFVLVLCGGAFAAASYGIYWMRINLTAILQYVAAFAVLIVSHFFFREDVSLFLFLAPVFFLCSMVLWSFIHHTRLRHITLFHSILMYILGIWFQMIALHNFPLRDMLYPLWNKLFDSLHVEWLNAPIDLMSFVLSLLTGCLLIISWSTHTPCEQWNPFSAGTLMQSRRTATLALGFSVVIFFAQLDGHYRLSFVIFLMQLALNVTITIFCHTLQDDANTRRYVTEYILFEKRFKLSNLTSIHDKLSRVSQCCVSGIKKYGLREQSAYFEALLHSLVWHARRIDFDRPNRLSLWGIAIGFSSLPLNCRKPEELYKYAVRLYRFIVCRNAEDDVADDLYEHILLGLLLAMIKLCDESREWELLFQAHQNEIVHLYKDDLVIPDAKKNQYLAILTSTMSPSVVGRLRNAGLPAPTSLNANADDRDLLSIFSGAYRSIDAINRDIKEFDWR